MERKTILVIDDEQDFAKLLKLNLESAGEYRVLTAGGAEEGLAAIERERPDLVLLDIMMPGLGGLEALPKIKALSPETPVAMVTAVWKEDEAKRAFRAGAYEYITKPVDLEHLRRALLVKLFA
ncbi:MAG TPA: response regulator [bacterium]